MTGAVLEKPTAKRKRGRLGALQERETLRKIGGAASGPGGGRGHGRVQGAVQGAAEGGTIVVIVRGSKARPRKAESGRKGV